MNRFWIVQIPTYSVKTRLFHVLSNAILLTQNQKVQSSETLLILSRKSPATEAQEGKVTWRQQNQALSDKDECVLVSFAN